MPISSWKPRCGVTNASINNGVPHVTSAYDIAVGFIPEQCQTQLPQPCSSSFWVMAQYELC
eukprot:170077-Amphidinium_carterae.1